MKFYIDVMPSDIYG